jgi:mannose-1-phosphate guanylyltransferase
LRLAAYLITANPEATYLFGTEPDSADTELGYIVPVQTARSLAAEVARFAEKPALEEARALVLSGALWNLFILGGTVRAMLKLFNQDYAGAVSAMRAALARDRRATAKGALAELYADLTPFDFSHEILQHQTAPLRVIRVPPCGWTDLGTPHRVALTVRDIAIQSSKGNSLPESPLFFDLGRLARTG